LVVVAIYCPDLQVGDEVKNSPTLWALVHRTVRAEKNNSQNLDKFGKLYSLFNVIVNRGEKMNISTRGRYGLRALLEIATQPMGRPLAIRDISEKQQMSVTYLEQILHKLKNAGIVKSVRGAKGGYVLARDVDEITVSQIINALDGPISISYCDAPELREKSCIGPKACVSRMLWKRLEDLIDKALSSVTLADLQKEASGLKTLRRKFE
jgi:Rrf2 family protein